MSTQNPVFNKAAGDSAKLTSKPGSDDLLELYALFKVAHAEDFSKTKQPGMFDMKEKYKYNAWKAKVDEGLTPELAQEQYIAKVEALKASHGFDENKQPEAVGGK